MRALRREQPGGLGSEHIMGEQRRGRRDFHFRTPVGTVVKRHLIQRYCAIALLCKREAEWKDKRRRMLRIQVEGFRAGR